MAEISIKTILELCLLSETLFESLWVEVAVG